jgi:RNA polymerase sigma-70 factor (ECF subfamily)
MTSAARPAPPELALEHARDWVARAVAGERAAQERLVREQWPLVERLLMRILGPRADLEDLVQNVFFETFRALPRFRGDSKVSTFVGGIAVRVAMRAMRRPRSAPVLVPLPDELRDTAGGPERRAHAARQLATVRRILEGMADVKRVAFTLWALDGMGVEAIAELMDASVPATRSRLYYAQKELRERAAAHPELRELIGGER